MGKRMKYSLILIFSLTLIGPLGIDLFLPSLTQMIDYFKVTSKEMHLTISVYMVFLGVSQLAVGAFSDKKGRRASALLGTVMYFLGSIVSISSNQFYVLLLGRAVQGLGAASCTVSATAWVRENFSQKESVKWLSYMIGIIGIVPAFAPSLGSFIADFFGWKATFGFKAILSAGIFIGVYWVLPKGIKVLVKNKQEIERSIECGYKSILLSRLFRRYNLISIMSMTAILTFVSNAPIVGMKIGGLSSYAFSLLFGIIGVTELIFNFISPKISSKIGQQITIKLGLFLILVFGFVFFFISAQSTILYFILVALAMAAVALIVGPSVALTLADFKTCAGKASSLDGFLRMTIGSLLSMFIGVFDFEPQISSGISFLMFSIPLLFIFMGKKIKVEID